MIIGTLQYKIFYDSMYLVHYIHTFCITAEWGGQREKDIYASMGTNFIMN